MLIQKKNTVININVYVSMIINNIKQIIRPIELIQFLKKNKKT